MGRKWLLSAHQMAEIRDRKAAGESVHANGDGEKGKLKDVANGQGLANVKPVAAGAGSEAL